MRLTIFFLLFSFLFTSFLSFSQIEIQPFDISQNEIRQHAIKSIKEFDTEQTQQRFAIYDTLGIRTHFDSQNLKIDYQYTYDKNGYLIEKQVSECVKIDALKLQTNHFNGKLTTANYTFNFMMEIIEVFEQYFYNSKGQIKEVALSFPPFDNKAYTRQYEYDDKGRLTLVKTFFNTDEKPINLFNTTFQYQKKNTLLSTLKSTFNNDTIDYYLYNKNGAIINRKYDNNLINSPKHTVNGDLYEDFFQSYNSPLNIIFLHRNLDAQVNALDQNLIEVAYTYDSDKLITEEHTTAIKDKALFKTIRYLNDGEKMIISHGKNDTALYKYKTEDINAHRKSINVELNPKTKSQLHINQFTGDNNDQELIIKFQNHIRECITYHKIDTAANSFQKATSCYNFRKEIFNPISSDLKIPKYIPVNSKLSSLQLGIGFKINENGDFVQHSRNEWQYLISTYSRIDSLLIEQKIYSDSEHTKLIHTLGYTYTESGYQILTRHADPLTIESLGESISFYDNNGKIQKTTWPVPNSRSIEVINYTYNDRGLCTAKIVDFGFNKVTTSFEYTYFD